METPRMPFQQELLLRVIQQNPTLNAHPDLKQAVDSLLTERDLLREELAELEARIGDHSDV